MIGIAIVASAQTTLDALAKSTLPQREVKTDMGLTMQPEEKIRWMRDARIGMFIHWGLYAGPAKGEWYMERSSVPIDEYRRLAYAESGEQYFDASDYRPAEWMRLAKDMGARYTCLTTQHHDGYCLFESHYPTAFTSVQTHNRDFVRKYVEAAREAGMRVGLYKTLINWRHPGYYDVTGTDCKRNNFGYTTAAWHKEDARQMKEELFMQTRELCSNYGPIDYIFWDGGWLAQQGTDADAAYFWEPGLYTDPQNPWPVNPFFAMTDSVTGRQLGLMGMVRRLQPDLVANLRSGWCGDYLCDEGPKEVKGPIRQNLVEKCMSLTWQWGYTTETEDIGKLFPLSQIIRTCADCMVRDMCFLINVGPDRHGHIPDAAQRRLREFGQWTAANAPAIYGTRGGPWQPVDGQYGFTYCDNMLYVFFLGGYTDDTFSLPELPKGMKARHAYMLDSGQNVALRQKGQTVTLTHLLLKNDEVTVVAVEFK
ncbi:MAG: alpha-L-fucosidase [Bacteroidaceae bacterium]|nr:alpha-L-fucosidase [Bacteroidaceae bacterium]